MRRFFDYNFDGLGLELELTSYLSTPVITPFLLELIPVLPTNPPLSAEIDGTSGDDVLEGTPDADTIQGGLGDDVINGNDGNDRLYGEEGDDILNGGEGNDNLYYEVGGRDVLNGNAGNDIFWVTNRESDIVDLVTVMGGSGDDTLFHIDRDRFDIEFFGGVGNDTVEIHFGNIDSEFLLDLGEGNDTLQIGEGRTSGDGNYQVTLGAGQDIIIMDHVPETLVITDFETGDGGDIFLFNAFENIFGWDNIGNLFDLGYFELFQDGQDTILRLDSDGAGTAFVFDDLTTFENTLVSDFTAYNFAGLPPQGGPILGETIDGTAGFDNLRGTLGADTINGLDGGDTIFGGAGHDIINGGDGRDRLYGEAGDDILNGGNGNDSLSYEVGGNDVLNGDAGDDRITIAPIEITEDVFTVIADGGDGNDKLIQINSAQINLTLIGGEGDDIADIRFGNIDSVFNLDLGAGNDIVQLGSLTSSLIKALGHYTISLGAGSDELNILNIGITPDNISLPLPTDIVVTDFETGVSGDNILFNFSENLEAWDGTIDPFANNLARIVQHTASTEIQFRVTDTSTNFDEWSTVATLLGVEALAILSENIAGYSPQDFLIYEGDAADNVISGTGNDDELSTFAGDDIITGGEGDDIIDGGDDTDHAVYSGVQANYTVTDNGDGTFTITDNVGTDGTDTLDNIEFLIFSDGTVDIATAANGSGGTGATPGDDILNGTAGDDTIDGLSGDDTINGLEGNDTLIGGLGDDEINGGEGDDMIVGGQGTNTLNGDDGNDTFEIEIGGYGTIDGGAGFDEVNLFTDELVSFGTGFAADNPFISITTNSNTGQQYLINNVERYLTTQSSGVVFQIALIGDNEADTLDLTNDTPYVFAHLLGGGGDDVLTAQMNGRATLNGGNGTDTLIGGSEQDTLEGGFGADVMTGGLGNDVFWFRDTGEIIGDFVTDTEIGDSLFFLNDAFTQGYNTVFIGTEAFGGTAGELRYELSGTQTVVQIDEDGDGISDGFMTLEGSFILALDEAPTDPSFPFILVLEAAADINGTLGDDNLTGTSGNDVINALDGNDTVDGLEGNDTISGGAGDDTFIAGLGADTIDGGDGLDILSFVNASAAIVIFSLDDGTLLDATGSGLGTELITSIEGIIGSGLNDLIVLSPNSTDTRSLFFDGGAGNDFIRAGNGDDELFGGDGDDNLRGNGGDDMVFGGAGDDFIRSDAGVDTIDGGEGDNDRISFFNLDATQGVIADLRTGITTNDGFGNMETFTNIEGLGAGTAFADLIDGDDNDNLLLGAGFGDTINAYAGDDTVQVDSGGTYDGGAGTDTFLIITFDRLIADTDGDGFAEFEAQTTGVTVDLQSGVISEDGFGGTGTAVNFENLIG
ncbi:hypothetical protein N9W89_13015, partial [Hellea sp.]|nr:hypothetical protein [Hellea sp.]